MSANETDDHGAIARRRRDTLVLITGASSGIGRATAERFAARGAHVLLLARREPRLREIVEDLAGRGASADYYPVDLADAGAVATVAERIKAEHGVPDIVVNNAGAGRWLPAVETSPDEARQMIELPYLAAFYVTRAFLPEMLARGHGHIACVTSPRLVYRLAERMCLHCRASRPQGLHRGTPRGAARPTYRCNAGHPRHGQ